MPFALMVLIPLGLTLPKAHAPSGMGHLQSSESLTPDRLLLPGKESCPYRPPGGWTGNGIAAFSYTQLMDESGKNIVKVINEKVEITGAAALTFTGYPPTVVVEPGLKEDRPPENSPEIILGADLVDVREDTDDGQLIQYVEIPWLAIAEELARNPEFLFEFDPRQFEEFIAASYDREGWDVELTPRSADGGRDVIATRNDFGSIRVYDEVKRYSKGERVTAEKVRALSGVVHGHQNVSKGIVTTTAEFAPGVWTDTAIAPLMPNRLELRDGKRLLEWIQSLRKKDA